MENTLRHQNVKSKKTPKTRQKLDFEMEEEVENVKSLRTDDRRTDCALWQ